MENKQKSIKSGSTLIIFIIIFLYTGLVGVIFYKMGHDQGRIECIEIRTEEISAEVKKIEDVHLKNLKKVHRYYDSIIIRQ